MGRPDRHEGTVGHVIDLGAERDGRVAPARPSDGLRSILQRDAPSNELPPPLDASQAIEAVVVVPAMQTEDLLPRLEEIVAAEALMRDPRAQVLTFAGSIVTVASSYRYGTERDRFGQALLDRARASFPLDVTVGVGRPHAGTEGLRRSYREAVWAATAGRLLWGGDRVVSYRDLGVYGMLEPFVADPESADTGDVEALLSYDRANGTDLVRTVEALFKSGSSGDAAAALYVHRNTVIYRIRVIKRVTGLDLRDPDQRLLLELQVRLARLRGLLPVRRIRPRRGARK